MSCDAWEREIEDDPGVRWPRHALATIFRHDTGLYEVRAFVGARPIASGKAARSLAEAKDNAAAMIKRMRGAKSRGPWRCASI